MTSAARTIEDLARSRPELVELAKCVSLTIGVDHGFLRRARLRFLPRTTAGLEAELWFSALVEAAGSQSLLLHPRIAERLRADLALHDPRLLREVRDFTASEHARAPLVVRLYEELLWSGLTADAPDPEVARHAELVLRTVSGQGTTEGVADDTGRWALHYAHRLPDHLLAHDDVWRIQVASCERLGLEPPPDPAGRRSTLTAQARAGVQRTMAVGVSVRSDGIVLSRPPAPGARIVRAKGTRHRVRIDALSALAHAAAPVRLELLDRQSVHLPFTVVQRLGPDGDVRMSLAHPGTAVDVAVSDFTGTSPQAAHCALLFADGTIVLHGGDGSETGRLAAVGASGGLALSPDGRVVSYVRDGVRRLRLLRGGVESESGSPEPDSAVPVATPLSEGGDQTLSVRATGDGWIAATTTLPSGETSHWRVGRPPWQVTALAVGADRQRVAAVGNDTVLLEFHLPGTPGPWQERRRDTILRFCADRVFAMADGSWVVAGSGGPVDLATEDGRAYRLLPGLEPAAEAPGIPAWGRGCVLVEAQRASEALPGVNCLVVDAPERADGLSPQLSAAHRRGVRVIVDVDLSVPDTEVLDTVVELLDQGVDGLRITGAGNTDPALVEDVRHLLDGYDDRLLLSGTVPRDTHRGVFHVVPATALVSTLGFALRSRSIPGGTYGQALSRLRTEIETTFASARAEWRGESPECGLALPPALTPSAQRLAAGILLSLPGCPVLPGGLLTDGTAADPALGPLLELRGNHLALTRGACEVLDVGTPHVLAVARRHGDDAVLCLVNVAQIPMAAALAPDLLGDTVRLQDPLDGSVIALSDERAVSLPMAASSVRWLRMLAR